MVMDQPPRKRRRIEISRSFPDEHEIECDKEEEEQDLHPEVRERLEVRSRFKSQLERIFEKYSRDFTAVGDEIDLVTGRIVVDNGHLLRMQEEDDVGDDTEDQEELSGLDYCSITSEAEARQPTSRITPGVEGEADQDADDDPLVSLHIDSSLTSQTHSLRRPKYISISRASDPRWQIPDVPEAKFEHDFEEGWQTEQGAETREKDKIDNATRTANKSNGRIPKSPGGSLWSYPKDRNQVPINLSENRLSRGARSIWNDSSDELSEDTSCEEPFDHDDVEGEEKSHEAISHGPLEKLRSSNRDADKSTIPPSVEDSRPSKSKKHTTKARRDTLRDLEQSLLAPDHHEIPLEDMWMAFPPIGQPTAAVRAMHGNRSMASGCVLAIPKFDNDWQRESHVSSSAAALVPYGSGASLVGDSDQADSLSLQQCQHLDEANSDIKKNPSGLEMDANSKISFSVTVDDDVQSSVRSEIVDLMELGSDTFMQDTDYTPLSLRSPPRQRSWPQRFTRDRLDLNFSHASPGNDKKPDVSPSGVHELSHTKPHERALQDSRSRRRLGKMSRVVSVANTTQDTNSQSLLKSSCSPANYATLQASDHELSLNITGESPVSEMNDSGNDPVLEATEQEDLAYNTNLDGGSRESSPLSSLSSSDPRIARSFELQTSGRDNITPAASLRIVTRVFNVLPSADTKISNQISTRGAEEIRSPQARKMRNKLGPRSSSPTHPHQKRPLQFKVPSLVPGVLQNTYHSNALNNTRLLQTVQTTKVKLGAVKPTIRPTDWQTSEAYKSKINMDGMNHLFQSMNDSFTQSQILLEASVKRDSLATAQTANTFRGSHAVNKPFIPVLPKPDLIPHKHAKLGPQSAVLLKGNKAEERQASERTDWPDKTLARNRSKDKAPTTKVHKRISDEVMTDLTKEQEVLQNQRETTPIDTYCYMLADPWPVEPLPKGQRLGQQGQTSQHKSPTYQSRPQSPNIMAVRGGRDNSRPLSESAIHLSPSKALNERAKDSRSQSRTRLSKATGQGEASLHSLLSKTLALSTGNRDSRLMARRIVDQAKAEDLYISSDQRAPVLSKSEKVLDQYTLPETPGAVPNDSSSASLRSLSPDINITDILNEFGRGRPLTRANLLSQDEVPSTSQDTILSFLNSQATTQIPWPPPTKNSSSLAHRSHIHKPGISSTGVCGVDEFRCGRRYCFNCTSTAATQEEIEF